MKKAAVLGAGTMGNGIAQALAQAGIEVKMVDTDSKYIERGIDSIKKSLGMMSEKNKITEDEADAVLSRIKGTTSLNEAAADADYVIEAITEDLDMKQDAFRKLDEICPVHTILATNTSTMSITAIASVTKRPEKVVGAHFAYPVPIQVGVVINRGLVTSDETMEITRELLGRMGKEIMVNRDSPGFAGNRLLPLFINEAFNVAWEGIATPEDIDKDVKLNLRHPMGPFELADFLGLDQILNGLEYMYHEWGEKYRPSPLLKQYVAAGYYGRKTGRGVYKYD
ncbi:3-hydroxyacyl-CoA dehydrogenase family protein [Chloroflexota bacterium]